MHMYTLATRAPCAPDRAPRRSDRCNRLASIGRGTRAGNRDRGTMLRGPGADVRGPGTMRQDDWARTTGRGPGTNGRRAFRTVDRPRLAGLLHSLINSQKKSPHGGLVS